MSDGVIWLFAAIIIVGGAFLVLMALTRKGPRKLDPQKYRERWLAISNSVTNDAGSQQLAVLNADKLLDQALKERGIVGETMGERLKNAKHLLGDNNAIWTAHKLRNRIAHEDSVNLTPGLTRKALATFKSALKDVGAL